jgi:hypothetical protein
MFDISTNEVQNVAKLRSNNLRAVWQFPFEDITGAAVVKGHLLCVCEWVLENGHRDIGAYFD